jgi:hypothetical protein
VKLNKFKSGRERRIFRRAFWAAFFFFGLGSLIRGFVEGSQQQIFISVTLILISLAVISLRYLTDSWKQTKSDEIFEKNLSTQHPASDDSELNSD